MQKRISFGTDSDEYVEIPLHVPRNFFVFLHSRMPSRWVTSLLILFETSRSVDRIELEIDVDVEFYWPFVYSLATTRANTGCSLIFDRFDHMHQFPFYLFWHEDSYDFQLTPCFSFDSMVNASYWNVERCIHFAEVYFLDRSGSGESIWLTWTTNLFSDIAAWPLSNRLFFEAKTNGWKEIVVLHRCLSNRAMAIRNCWKRIFVNFRRSSTRSEQQRIWLCSWMLFSSRKFHPHRTSSIVCGYF